MGQKHETDRDACIWWGRDGGWLPGSSLVPSGSEPFLHSSSSALGTKLWFGFLHWCCHFCHRKWQKWQQLDGWTTQLPFAPVLQGNTILHQSARDYLRLRIRIRGLTVSGTGIMCRNPPGGLGTKGRHAYTEQPLLLTFPICGWNSTCHPHSSLGHIDSASSGHLTLTVLEHKIPSFTTPPVRGLGPRCVEGGAPACGFVYVCVCVFLCVCVCLPPLYTWGTLDTQCKICWEQDHRGGWISVSLSLSFPFWCIEHLIDKVKALMRTIFLCLLLWSLFRTTVNAVAHSCHSIHMTIRGRM